MANDEKSGTNEKLYIPYGLKTEKEFMNGFGVKQFAQTALVTLIAVGIGFAVTFVTGKTIAVWACLILGIAVGYFITVKPNNTRSALELIHTILHFGKIKQKFPYYYRQFTKNGGGFLPTHMPFEDFEKKRKKREYSS